MRKILALFAFIFCFSSLKAQDFSNKGKDFWLAYGSHCQMYTGSGAVQASGGSQEMVLYIATDQLSVVKVEIPLLGYSQTYTIPANTVYTTPPLPKVGAQECKLTAEGVSDKGIHVTSNKNVVAYAHIYNGSISGATLLFPQNVLGKEYYSINFTQTSNQAFSYPYFFAVATDTGTTTIEVTPSANTQTMTAGTTYTFTLTQGQVFNALGALTGNNGVDLTGSKIKSISSAGGGCKKIAVFSGAGKINICAGNGSADNYIQQAFPKEAWGTRFLTVPTAQMPFNYYRICVSDPTAIVKRNGVVLGGLINNFYYQVGAVNDLGLIEADKPITVAQYITTRGVCGNTNFGPPSGFYGDPEVIYLSPVEQNIAKVILNSTPNSAIGEHYINAVLKTNSINSFKIDGINYGSSFLPHPQDPTYSYIQRSLTAGQHTVEADSGFNAIAYGYGSAESYGYNAGTNVKDFTQNSTAFSPGFLGDTTLTKPIFCKNSTFNLFQRLPYKPISITWDFTGSGLPAPPFNNYTSNNPVSLIYDSAFVGNKWVYRFRNPNPYIVNTSGIYPFTVIVNNPTSDGCTGLQELDYELEIQDPPTVDFNWNHTGCVTDTVYFRENTVIPIDGRPIFKWRWSFHDNTTDSIKTPKKLYTVGGSFPVKLQVISDIGCLSDTLTKTIDISAAPICTVNVTGNPCVGSPLTFTPNCSIAGSGTISQWIWNWDDGTPNDTLLAGTPINHTFLTVDTFNVTITAISSTGCKGTPLIINVIIYGPPAVNFTLPSNVCLPVGLATFTNTSNGGNPAGLSYTWNFGDASPTTNTINGVHNYSAVGPFNVVLSALSPQGCTSSLTQIFNNIRPRPTANFTNNPEVCIKDSLQFTSTSNGNGGSITNNFWDFGDATTSSLPNPKKKWATNGSKTVKHWIVTDQGCTSDTMTKTIYVNASPVADFNFSNLGRCARTLITFNNTSTAADGVINQWVWDFGDGSPLGSGAGPIQHTYLTEGTFNVKLVVTTDKGCVADTVIKPIVITATPVSSFNLPGGICLPSGFAQFTNNTTISDGTIATVTYVWDFGDLTPTSTLFSPSHNYTGTGPYNVKLTATSAIGCVDDSIQVLSNIYAQPQANFTTNPEVCLNANITFTSTSVPLNGTITEYYWDNGTGAFVLGAATATISFATPGTKTIRHYIKTSNGCISDTMTKTIFVNQLPTANFTYSATRCEKDNITFTSTAIPNDGNLNEWTWDFGDGSPVQVLLTGAPVVHVFNTSGTYNVKLTVKTDKGCASATNTQAVVVNPKPVANFNLPADVCLPVGLATFINTTTISDATLPLVTYIWNFGDASPTTTTINGVHNYTAVGPFNVTLQTTSNNGCKHDTIKVFNTIRPRPTAGFNSNPEVCLSDSLQFTSTSTGNGGTITNNFWDFGDATTSTAANPKKKWATSGTKTVKHWILTDQGCYSDTMTKTIYVNALPTPNFNISAPLCVDKNITFTNSSIANDGVVNSWTWDFGDASAIVTGAGPHLHSYAATGSYNVSLSVITDKGCTNTPVIKPVVINPNPVVKMYLPEICLNDPTAQFLDSSTIADGTENLFTYLWNFGDPNATPPNPNTSTLKNPTHQYIQAANYNMWLEVTSNRGCISRKDTVFTVNGATPVANFTVQNAAALCSNTDVTIQNTSTVNFGSVTVLEIYWDWTNNPLLKTVDQNPTPGKLYNYAYSPFGLPATRTYTIRLVAYSGAVTGPCVNAITRTITLLASPNVVFTSVPDICQENTPATLVQAQETTGIPGTGVFTGPGIVGNNFNPAVAGVGTHTIRYTFTGTNGCTTYKEQTVTVNPTPNANAGPDKTVLEGGNTTLQGSSTTSNVTYLWTPATYLNNTIIPQPVCTALDDITYTLQVTSDKGCKATDQVFVKVLKGPRIPNAFSPNGDGFNDTWEIEFIDTYPGCIIEVYNIYGQKIFRSVGYSKPWDGKYNGNPLPIGTYYYIVEPKNGRKTITGYVGIVR